MELQEYLDEFLSDKTIIGVPSMRKMYGGIIKPI